MRSANTHFDCLHPFPKLYNWNYCCCGCAVILRSKFYFWYTLPTYTVIRSERDSREEQLDTTVTTRIAKNSRYDAMLSYTTSWNVSLLATGHEHCIRQSYYSIVIRKTFDKQQQCIRRLTILTNLAQYLYSVLKV